LLVHVQLVSALSGGAVSAPFPGGRGPASARERAAALSRRAPA